MCSVAHGQEGSVQIRPITTDEQLEASLAVIRAAFATVAARLGLTAGNCPTHPSFITIGGLVNMRDANMALFGLYEGDEQAGFVAVENAGGGVWYLEKLAVLPERRRAGRGERLVRHAVEYVRSRGGDRVSIGVIDDELPLKRWYARFGFAETAKKRYPHLPFAVCFMEMRL